MYVENRQFSHPLYLTPPMKGLPLEFDIGVRGPKCLNDEATRWSKKFSDRFSRFDTIPAVTAMKFFSPPPMGGVHPHFLVTPPNKNPPYGGVHPPLFGDTQQTIFFTSWILCWTTVKVYH